jgi:hypothetical protein
VHREGGLFLSFGITLPEGWQWLEQYASTLDRASVKDEVIA